MTWFDDLTPYSYLEGQDGARPTLNVGWLEHGHPFPTGDAPAGFIERLEMLAAHGQTQVTRGLHECDICPTSDDEDVPCGSAELRAVGVDGIRYAAPTLIVHYVTKHRYLPPKSFVDAVLRVSLEWKHAEANDLCISCGNAMTRTQCLDGMVRGPAREPVIVVYLACDACGTNYTRAFPDPSRG